MTEIQEPAEVPTRDQERAQLEQELEHMRAAMLSLEHIGEEHREILAHTLNEMMGWAAERCSLATHERRPFDHTHWMQTYRWLSALLGTVPGRHIERLRADDAAALRPCWCPIGVDHDRRSR